MLRGRYITFAVVGLLAFTTTALQCDTQCRKQCISQGNTDSCVVACGCESLSNAVTMKFTEQQMCQSNCKNSCLSKPNIDEATLCSLTCASACNQVCTFMCDFYDFGTSCKSDCGLQLPKREAVVLEPVKEVITPANEILKEETTNTIEETVEQSQPVTLQEEV